MNFVEHAVIFCCAGEQLPGIFALPEVENGDLRERSASRVADCGVLIVVGGPQYRAGSHRQFLLLSRRLAAGGFPTFRFDYRGMGDASGEARNFEHVSDDIAAAINAFQQQCPNLRRIVLWGLCDAASASLMYVQAARDARVSGLVLLNPWVRSASSLAQTQIKHYYVQRLLRKEFWWKLLTGRMAVGKALGDFLRAAVRAKEGNAVGKKRSLDSFQSRMALGWRYFSGRVLLILSGDDYTAKEFLGFVTNNSEWSGLLDSEKVTRVDIEQADHTFSTAVWRAEVEDATLAWLAGERGF